MKTSTVTTVPLAAGRSTMNRVLIWDVPLRVLHWGLAGAVTSALVIGLVVDDDHPAFAYHMLFGLIAGGFVVLRLVLAVVGSRHARFSSLVLRPQELLRYALGSIAGHARRYDSHNPGTSWMAVLLWGLVAVLILTGLFPGGRGEEVHEVAAYAVLALVAAHMVGLGLHTLRHREFIAWAMVDGRKQASASSALPSSGRWTGLALAALALVGLAGVFRGFDARTGRLQLPGTNASIELMKGEDHQRRGEGEHEHRDD